MSRRRKITVGDFVSGAAASLRKGTIMNPLVTQRMVNRAHDQRVVAQLGRDAIDLATQGAIRKFLDKANSSPYGMQYSDQDVHVKVSSGWSRQHRCSTTNIIVAERNNKEEHLHVVLLEDGTEIYNEWRRNP